MSVRDWSGDVCFLFSRSDKVAKAEGFGASASIFRSKLSRKLIKIIICVYLLPLFPRSPPIISSDQYLAENQNLADCLQDHNEELSFLNKSLTQEAKHGFEVWADFDEQQDNFCILDDHQSGAEYVDLLLNPERYTGYRGKSAHRIWRSIYLENCFDGAAQSNALLSHINAVPSTLNSLCMEQRSFYRLISGLHSSINIHLTANYLLAETNNFMSANAEWGRNVDEFIQRFSADSTKGEGPNWLKNLYFIYLIELRALAKAAPWLRNEPYFTGNDEEDEAVQTAVNDILDLIQ